MPFKHPRKSFRRGVKSGGGSRSRVLTRIPRAIAPKGWFVTPSRGRTPICYIERSCYTASAFATTSPGGVNAGFGALLQFSLDALPNYTELTPVWDQYCICSIKIELKPQFDVSEADQSVAGPMGSLSEYAAIVDVDSGNTAPTAFSQMMERAGVKSARSDRPMTFTFQPRTAVMQYLTPVTTGYAVSKPGYNWIDCQNPSMPHYGMALYMAAPPRSGLIFRLDYKVTYKLAFKDPK